MKELSIKLISKELANYNKIIVTGPPRAGTTFSGLVIAHELKYKFIDESWYDANNPDKFMMLLGFPRKMIVHTTAFLRDLHTISNILDQANISVVLVKRSIKDILDSIENTKNFKKGVETINGVMVSIGKEEQDLLFKAYGGRVENISLPEVIYNYFYSTMYKLNQDKLYSVNYDDFKNHELFISKKERRKKFKHGLQVNFDPHYLVNQKGVMVL